MIRVTRLLVLMLAAVASAAEARAKGPVSHLTAVEVAKVEPAGTFDDIDYVRIGGTVRGIVAPGEAVVGLDALPKRADGTYAYASAFEIIAPAAHERPNAVVYVDAENRGAPISQGALGGFLQRHATTYARVQWQTGISPGVPASAQGVGLVIVRDFGRWLAGRTPQTRVSGGAVPAPHAKLMLGGISQSAWLVNTLVAEGFNVDPASGKRVFDAAIAIDGLGNWLAVNRIAAERGVAQTPYVDPNGVPLSRAQLLSRPATDPLFVDVANYSDYYRLRASVTATDFSGPRFRRYDFPSPHAVGTAQSGARCNNGEPTGFHALRYAPYMRALVLGMQKAIGVESARAARPLPKSRIFELVEAPPGSEYFNPLPGAALKVPAVSSTAWPIGGVRFPEADLPTGRPIPAAVPPVVTTSISATCGNFSGWEAFTAADMARAFESREAYGAEYARRIDALIAEGFLLAEDKAAMVEAAKAAFPAI